MATYTIDVELPMLIEVDDYHEIDSLQNVFKRLNKDIKVMGLGFDGQYLGIAYVGNLKDGRNAPLVEKIKQMSKDYESS